MFRLFAFVLTCLGGLNWLMIGALQYDFIAGIFGTQANVFSRIIYFIIGIASIYILIVTILIVAKVAIKIYSSAILNYGTKMSFKDILNIYKEK